MNKKEFYKEQQEKFWDFRRRVHSGDLLSIFEKWCNSKDFSEEDKKEIWMLVSGKTE